MKQSEAYELQYLQAWLACFLAWLNRSIWTLALTSKKAFASRASLSARRFAFEHAEESSEGRIGKAVEITDEIKTETFNYPKWFPKGNKAERERGARGNQVVDGTKVLRRGWWPRLPKREPDPYTEQERETIQAYYRANRPARAYAFVFWTGTRPSEATALKWGSVDLVNGKATFAVTASRRRERAKTRASRRTVTLLPNVADLLRSTLPLRLEPNSYVFTDGQGKPIDQSEFARGFSSKPCCAF